MRRLAPGKIINETQDPAYVWIRQTDESTDQARGSVFGLDSVEVTPTDNDPEYRYKFVFQGVAPSTTTHANKFAITIEAMAGDGEFVRAKVHGPVHCVVNVTDTAHPYATLKDGDKTNPKF